MILRRVLWALFIIGTLLPYTEGNETDNGRHASTNPSFDDDYPNYSDYVDNRDYPNLDYNDDREDRSLHGHQNPPSDDNDQPTDPEEFFIKQLKSTIPGTPGVDYALYQSVPDTSFKCDRPGFYGDVEAQCQVFHICQENDRHDSFLCPVGTVFNQISFICDWWFNFNCEDTASHYHLNNKFHSSTGSKSMKDAMKRMRNFQENKDMQMIMGLAKVHKNFHDRRNINNRVSVKRSMSPKVKNLFMLRMRNKKLGEISNAVTSKNDDDVTTNTSPAEGTHLELKAASSTGHVDITLLDYTTTINSSVGDIYYNNTSTPETMNSNVTESISNHTLKQLSLLNSSPETTIYENVTMVEFEASTLAELITTMKNLNTTEISLREPNSAINSEANEFNSHFNPERDETEKPLETTLSQNETSFSNETLTTSNPVEKETTTIAYPKRPFKHENNFVIGNDTHISISVTIHSKFGPSKLQWKRLPGIKRVRKIHFKNTAESFNPRRNPVNETSYRKRNDREKPKSRVMWIPVKKNNLDRTLDNKAFLEPRIPAVPLVSRKEEVHKMSELKKAAVESSEIPSIYIKDFLNVDVENKTIGNSSKLLLDTEAGDIDNKQSNITAPTESFETALFLVENKHQNLVQLNETGNFSDVGDEKHQAVILKNTSNQNEEDFEHCKTICIKLLRSLNANSSNSLNSTELEKVPSALTLFDYDSPESRNNHEYGRKSLLEISSSEHWTVKYDPGPNCNENTEDGKVLVKGWSVIIDTGSVTKEKTVKKRGCTDSSKQRRFVIKEDLFTDRSTGNRGIRFHTENSTKPFNSASESKFGSNDQRYWLNLVKNWLEQSSSNENQRTNKKVYPEEKNSNNERLFGSFPNFRNNGQYSDSDQNDERNKNLRNHNLQIDHDFGRNHQEGLVDESPDLNLESRNAKQLDRKSKNSMPFKQIGIRKQLKIQNSKTDRYSDLQTERSDWSRATQRANDRTNYERNKRDSYGSYSDDYSATGITDLKEDPEDDWIDSLTDDTDYSAVQDEWLTKNFRDSRNRHGTENRPDGDNWSASLREQSKKDSMTPSGRNIGDSRRNFEWNLKNHQRTLSGNKNEKSDPRTKNWSLDSQEEERRRKATIASRGPDMHNRNNKGESSARSNKPAVHGKRATSGKGNTGTGKGNTGTGKGNTGAGKGNTGAGKGNTGTGKGNTGTGKGNTGTGKGNTGTGKGNTSTRKGNTSTRKGNTSTRKGNTNNGKGYDGFIHSTRRDNGNAWSDDETSPRRSKEGGSYKPKDDNLHTPKDQDQRKSWFSDEEQNWRRDSNSKESRKKDKDWNKSTDDNKGSISEDKSDWSSEENYWNSEEDSYDSQDRDWNEQSENKKFDAASDWSSESDYIPDWSSSSRGGRNKGFVVHDKGSSTQLSHNEPTWGADSSAARSYKGKGGTSDRALPRRNSKGRNDSRYNLRGKPSSRNHQSGSDQDYDDETWIADNSRDTDVGKGIKMASDWSTKPDLRHNVKPQNKGNSFQNQNPKRNSSPKGTNTSPWADKIPPNHKANINTERSRTSKGSSRGTSKGTMRRSHSTSKDANRQKPTWKDNHNPINSTNSKGDLDAKKIVWSVQISNDGKLGNGWVPITLRPTVKKNNETQNDWKGSSSRNADWRDRQDSSIDKSWNTKGSSSKDEDWKSVRDTSKNNKGISLIDADWKRKVDSSKDSSWITQGSSLKDEDWNNKDFLKGTDWSPEEGNGKASKDENLNKGNNEWSNKDIPTMDEWHIEEKGWSNKERFLNQEDWIKDDVSSVNDWNRKSSNKDKSSDNEDWKSNTSSPKSKAWDERRNENSKIEMSMDPNWHTKDTKSTNLKADVAQKSQTVSDQEEVIATEINPPIIHMTEESFSHLFYIPGYNFRYKRDYQNRDRHLKTRDTLKKSYKIIKSGEILDDASEDNDKFFLAKADIKVEGHLKYDEKNLKGLPQRAIEESIKNQEQNPITNTDERLDISPKESVIREIWSSPILSSNFSESGWIPMTAVKSLKTTNSAKFNPATSNKNTKDLSLKNSSSTIDNINLGIHRSDNDYLIVKNTSEEPWSPSTSKSFNILFSNKTEEPPRIKNTAGEKTKENLENGTEMKVGNKTLRILSFSDVMKQFENRGESSEDILGAQSASYNVPITIHPKKYSLKLVDPSEDTAKNNSNSWRFSTNENGMKQTWVLVRRNETKQIHPEIRQTNSNTNKSKKIIDGKKLNLYQVIIGNKTRTSETNNFTTTDSLLIANNETSFSFTNWNNNSDWTPIIRTVGRVVSHNRTLLLDTESNVH